MKTRYLIVRMVTIPVSIVGAIAFNTVVQLHHYWGVAFGIVTFLMLQSLSSILFYRCPECSASIAWSFLQGPHPRNQGSFFYRYASIWEIIDVKSLYHSPSCCKKCGANFADDGSDGDDSFSRQLRREKMMQEVDEHLAQKKARDTLTVR